MRAFRLGSWFAATALFLAPLLASSSEVTSVEVHDPGGPATLAKVSVVNAETGIPVAAGLTDPVSGRFSFSSQDDVDLVVAVLTTSGYAGAGRVVAGQDTSVLADRGLEELAEEAAQRTEPAAVSLDALELLDPMQSVEGAHFAVARWTSFASVAFGTVGASGQIGFSVPAELEDAYLLCIVWQDGQPVKIKVVRSSEIVTEDGGGEDGAFPTF